MVSLAKVASAEVFRMEEGVRLFPVKGGVGFAVQSTVGSTQYSCDRCGLQSRSVAGVAGVSRSQGGGGGQTAGDSAGAGGGNQPGSTGIVLEVVPGVNPLHRKPGEGCGGDVGAWVGQFGSKVRFSLERAIGEDGKAGLVEDDASG